jgi:hypothetical protein
MNTHHVLDDDGSREAVGLACRTEHYTDNCPALAASRQDAVAPPAFPPCKARVES